MGIQQYLTAHRYQVKSLFLSYEKKWMQQMGKSAGVDKIPTELVEAGGDAMIDVLTSVCNKILKTGE